jgi:DNA-binding NarL/FixJ family response regulator
MDKRDVAGPDGGAATDETRTGGSRPRVIIVDPDPLARRVIRDALQESDRGFVVPAETDNEREAIELCRYYKPEIVLIELGLANGDGVSATRSIAKEVPDARVLIFSREDSEEQQLEALAAGAVGFLSKSAEVDEVLNALDRVLQGQAVISPTTTMSLIERLRVLPEGGAGMRPVKSKLTQREWEILDLMSQGMDTHQMSEALVLAEETIYSHVKNVLRKLGVHSRRDAIEVAKQLRDPLAGLSAELDTPPNVARLPARRDREARHDATARRPGRRRAS